MQYNISIKKWLTFRLIISIKEKTLSKKKKKEVLEAPIKPNLINSLYNNFLITHQTVFASLKAHSNLIALNLIF